MRTIEQPKPPAKLYEWRCWNKSCLALMEARAEEGASIQSGGAAQYEFTCPHCGWHTTVPA